MEHQVPHNKALELILAGNATITLKNPRTGNRFTYRIKRMKTGDVHNVNDQRNAYRFVSVLTGNQNDDNNSYKYFADFKILNAIDFDGTQAFNYKFGKKAKIARDAQSVQVFEWVTKHLVDKDLPSYIEVWHSGHCCRCGRLLTVPESIEDGIGPECKRINHKK